MRRHEAVWQRLHQRQEGVQDTRHGEGVRPKVEGQHDLQVSPPTAPTVPFIAKYVLCSRVVCAPALPLQLGQAVRRCLHRDGQTVQEARRKSRLGRHQGGPLNAALAGLARKSAGTAHGHSFTRHKVASSLGYLVGGRDESSVGGKCVALVGL